MAEERDNPENLVLELRERIEVLERYAEERKREKLDDRVSDLEDAKPVDVKSLDPKPSGRPSDIRTKQPENPPVQEEVLGVEIEFGKPTADVTADGYSVTLQPCDVDGNSFASADTVDVIVPASAVAIELGLYGWTEATILSFIRFSPWLTVGATDFAGVLIGIGGPTASEPSGIIVMWGGAIVDIPTGWTLCDGGDDSNSVATPDLRGRFIAGSFEDTGVAAPGGAAGDLGEAGDYDAPGDTGGKAKHGPTENEHAKFRTYPTTTGTNNWAYWDRDQVTPFANVDTDNRPPYYTLAFIRKD